MHDADHFSRITVEEKLEHRHRCYTRVPVVPTAQENAPLELETMYATVDNAVATLTLNRPHVLNSANEQWARDLNTLVDDLAANDRIRVVVVRGAGRAFCSGIDITALSEGETGIGFF